MEEFKNYSFKGYEESCKEWLKGCSISEENPEECEECTTAFLQHLKNLSKKEEEELKVIFLLTVKEPHTYDSGKPFITAVTGFEGVYATTKLGGAQFYLPMEESMHISSCETRNTSALIISIFPKEDIDLSFLLGSTCELSRAYLDKGKIEGTPALVFTGFLSKIETSSGQIVLTAVG